tara:strand:- start:375 stop:539 length:165 start_codon:yes stop_codon:yes gene_type:complete
MYEHKVCQEKVDELREKIAALESVIRVLAEALWGNEDKNHIIDEEINQFPKHLM